MELIYAELSSPGPARENNEDYVGFWQPQSLEEKRSRGAVAVLADGVGGLNHGEVASRMAVETALRTFREAPEEEDATTVAHADVQRRQSGGIRQRHGEPRQVPHGDDPVHRRIAQQRNRGGQRWGFARISGPQGRDQAIVHGPYLHRNATKVRVDFRTGCQDQREPLNPDPQRRA